MLRAADIMKPAGAFRAARVGFFGAAALDRHGIDRNGGFDMVFHFPAREIANMRRVVREHLRKTALPARGASSTCSCGTNSPCFASALPARGASAKVNKLRHTVLWHTP